MNTPSFISFSPKRVHDQEGVSSLEFLFTILVVLGILMIVFQFSLIFLNAILANHALSLASQEAAARGGVDPTVQFTLLSHLPGGLRQQCTDPNGPVGGNCLESSIKDYGRVITGGRECTSRGQVFELTYTYVQDIGLLKIVGITEDILMSRTVRVASQSLNQPGSC